MRYLLSTTIGVLLPLFANAETPTLVTTSVIQQPRPTLDAHHFTLTEDATLGEVQHLQRRITLTQQYFDTDINSGLEAVSLATIGLGYTTQQWRFAVQLPAVMMASGNVFANQRLSLAHLQAININAKWVATTEQSFHWGLQINGGIPVNTEAFSTLSPGVELSVITEYKQDDTHQTLNLGYHHTDIANGQFLFVNLADKTSINKRLGFSVEGRTQYVLNKSNEQPLQFIAMAGPYWNQPNQTIQLSIGKNIQEQTTLPDWIVNLSLRHTNTASIDQDQDGVADIVDQCPTKPEDLDEYHDWDGCPEPNLTLVTATDGLTSELDRVTTIGSFEATGATTLKNSAATFSTDVSAEFEEQLIDKDHTIDTPTFGSLKLIALDANENEISHATWTITDSAEMPHRSVGLIVPLSTGTHEISIKANGFRPYTETIVIDHEEVHIVHLKLEEHTVQQDLSLPEKLYFATGSDSVDPRSYPLLDEVAELLHHYSRIELVHIEGHTDNVGSSAENQALSQRRAESVRRYLLQKGVSPERLIAIGYGDTQPIVSNDTEEGRHQNRRVIFNIQTDKE